MRKRLGLVMSVLALSAFAFGCGGGDTIVIGGDGNNGSQDKPGNNGDKPGNNGDKPGNNGDKPGNNGDKPGNNGEDPGNNGEDPGNNNEDPDVNGCVSKPDTDGDTISDEDEGKDENRDSDNDGIPDYLDLDSDGDTVPDKLEAMNDGCSGNAPGDALGIGIPNYLNDDSDGNGILDGEECCGKDEACLAAKDSDGLFTYCIDTDGNKIPDFLDDDNDGDGIDDLAEIEGENDGSNSAISINSFYGDCDGDGQPDAKGSASSPIDCDGDTIPDYMDDDSDGDGLPDRVESSEIVGRWYTRYSKDSDGNGISDAEECGVSNPASLADCKDTDGNGVPDVFDIDNDGDGLSDVDELNKYHTSMDSKDSDNDGVEDAVEIAIGTSPTDAADNPQAHGNFVFIVPYKEATTPKKQTLSFETAIQMVDIYFSFDASGSMSDEFVTLKNNLGSMIENLRCKDWGRACQENSDCSQFGSDVICSEKKRCITSPAAGVGCFDDMWTGFGTWGNINMFMNRISLSADSALVVNELARFTNELGCQAGDKYNYSYQGCEENSLQPSICAVFGSTYCTNASNSARPLGCYTGKDRFGCAGFRKDAIKVIVQAGDEANDERYPSYYNYSIGGKSYNFSVSNAAQWGGLLKDNKVRFVGLYGTPQSLEGGVRQMAQHAGSCAKTDCSNASANELYVTQITNTNVSTKAAEMVRNIARNMPIQITSTVEDIDAKAAQLIDHLEINKSGEKVQNRVCTNISNAINSGKYPGIKDLQPGTSVCYDVIPVDNQEIFPATSEPQMFKARIKILGDGSTLNSGIAYFVVPPVIIDNTIN